MWGRRAGGRHRGRTDGRLGRLPEPLAEPTARFAVECQAAEHVDLVGGKARVGTSVQQNRDRLRAVCSRSEDEGCLAGGRLARVGIGAVFEQSGHGFLAPHGRGGQVERGRAAVGRRSERVCARLQQQGNHVGVASAGGEVQGRVAPDSRTGAYFRPGVEQLACRCGVSVLGSQVKGGDAIAPGRVDLSAGPQQRADRLRVAGSGGVKEVVAEFVPLGRVWFGQHSLVDSLDRCSIHDADRRDEHRRQGATKGSANRSPVTHGAPRAGDASAGKSSDSAPSLSPKVSMPG